MPGEAREMLVVLGRDLDQWFRRRLHLHIAASRQCQAVAVAQDRRLGQVEQEGQATLPGVEPPAAEAIVEIHQHGVARLRDRPIAGAVNRRRAGDALLVHHRPQNRK